MKLLASVLSLVALSSLVACGEESVDPQGSGGGATGQGGGAGTGGATSGSGGAGGGDAPAPMRQTIEGDVTWTVTFDDTAKAAGATDCTYTRHYVGVEDESRPWLCPDCDVLFHADVEMTAGADDCFPQVSPDAPPLTDEWIGFANGTYYRGYATTTAQGTVAGTADAPTVANVVEAQMAPAGGTMTFDIAGAFTTAVEAGDPMHGFVAAKTYACGWPKADPAAYAGDYSAADGKTLPDGLFYDKCGDVVRLHDFKGKYLLVDMSARNCPPCQAMAGAEEQFKTDLAADGIEVEVITLMAPSLEDPLGETTKAMLTNWTNNYSLTGPVLADRGWGLAEFIPLYGDQVGYPSWVVTDPNLKILAGASGYDEFASAKTAIHADAGQ
jgi:thiol-disulfide isomerase/thioredoxin